MNQIFNENCLEGMKRIPDGAVDMVLCDLPYGTTASPWDNTLNPKLLWEQYLRVCKQNAPILLFANNLFLNESKTIHLNRPFITKQTILKEIMLEKSIEKRKMFKQFSSFLNNFFLFFQPNQGQKAADFLTLP